MLDTAIISFALKDPVAGNRENAIKMAELKLEKDPSLALALYRLRSDPSPKVRFQLLCTLGSLDTKEARSVREEILFEDMEDEWVQIAALTAVSIDPYSLLKKVKMQKGDLGTYLPFIRRLAEVIGSDKNENGILRLLDQGLHKVGSPGDQELSLAILAGLAQGLKGNKDRQRIVSLRKDLLVNVFFQHPNNGVKDFALQILEHAPGKVEGFDRAMALAKDERLTGEVRAQMLGFLRLGEPTNYAADLTDLIQPSVDPRVQMAALQIYDKIEGTAVCEFVLAQWELLTPAVREVAMQTFMGSTARVQMLLTALEEGKISKSDLGWQRTVRLNSHSDENIRGKARSLLAQNADEGIMERLGAVSSIQGDIVRGKKVFDLKCAVCHQVRGKAGVAYGPDLGTVHNWLPKDLLINIVDPGSSIAPGFAVWEIILKDGTKSLGIIESESSNAVEIVLEPGTKRTISRKDIQSIKAIPNVSPMPSFGDQLELSQIADLISFLRNSEDQAEDSSH